MTHTSLPKGRECLRDGRKEERNLARLKYAGGGVWLYFGARWQTVINDIIDLSYSRHNKMASLTSFKIIIAQKTSSWPRLVGIGDSGWPERVLLAVGLSAYKTRVAMFPLQFSMRTALQGEADNSLFGGECSLATDFTRAWRLLGQMRGGWWRTKPAIMSAQEKEDHQKTRAR
ncbi:hypothetical protein BDN72DRAFT_836678 [Pluteus cervinus]|uniref:Uncharacterized protein n=1 Tax=Pluteus cervinus TaxID=181527 RepID=A0ACD3B1F8_9AGAR|nr:hypothetical protein BDN72DRAFT_836678 [Pluteus cervinus]